MDFFFFKQKRAYEIGVRLVGAGKGIRDRDKSYYALIIYKLQKQYKAFAKKIQKAVKLGEKKAALRGR